MQRLATILGVSGKTMFILGFLLVCVVGTATEIPLHLFGLPLAALGGLLLAGRSLAAPGRRELPTGVATHFCLVVAYFLWRAWASPVQHLGEMDLLLVGAAASGFLAGRSSGSARWILPWLALIVLAGLAVSVQQITVNSRFTILGHWNLGRPPAVGYASGFFHNYNPYGGWSAMLVALFLAALVGGSGGWKGRVLAMVALLGTIAGVVLSFSRAGFLGTVSGCSAVVLLFFVVLSRWEARPRTKLMAFVAGVAVTFVLAFLVLHWMDLLAARRQTGGDLGALSRGLGGRDLYWRTGLSQFLQAKWIGSGARSFSYLSYQFWEMADYGIADPYYAHNEYVQTLADYGLVGLLLGVGFPLHVIWRALHLAMATGRFDTTRSGRAKVTACLAVLGVLVAAASDAFFSFNLHFAPQLLLLGFMAGVFSTLTPPGDEPRPQARPYRLAASGLVAAILLVSLVPIAEPGLRYARSTFCFLQADAALGRKEIDKDEHLAVTLRTAEQLPRYPSYVKAGETLLSRASDPSIEPARRSSLAEEAERWLSRAVEVFPQSPEAYILRGHAHWATGRYKQAEEDFLRAAKIADKREYSYRSMMLLGELRYARALECWEARDIEGTCGLLVSSMRAYEESKKRVWLTPRGEAGLRQVQEMIDFLKRTGEWKEP